MNELLSALAWQGLWLACGLSLLPWLRTIVGQDRLACGIALSAGPAVGVLPTWWLGVLVGNPHTRQTVIVALFLVASLNWLPSLWRTPPFALDALARCYGTLAALHSSLFAGYSLFRSFRPEIRYTEKPMELAFLTASVVSDRLPPPDPWFAGYTINYYVYGYIQMASLAKVLGLRPEVAFNLALGSLFASALVAAFVLASSVVRAVGRDSRLSAAVGASAMLFLVGAGNWETAWRILRDPTGTLAASWWSGPGWGASRVIVDAGFPWGGEPRPTINEFSAFSFILADLHPHLLALPLLLAYLSAVLAIAVCDRGWRGFVLSGLLLGCLWITNTWSLPLAVLVAGLVIVATRRESAARLIGKSLLALALASIVALPFQRTYVASYGLDEAMLPAQLAEVPIVSWLIRTVGIVVWERSSLGELLRAYGTLVVPALAVLWLGVQRLPVERRPRSGVVLAFAGFLVVLALASRTPAMFLFGLLIGGAITLLVSETTSASLRALVAVLLAAWLALLGVEFVYLRDVFGDRMNTVFKVSFDAWAYQAVALPPLLALSCKRDTLSRVVIGVVFGALLLGMLYVPLSAWKWTDGFAEARGLDGLAYLRESVPDEYAALLWLRSHTRSEAVILEAPGCSYRSVGDLPHNRVSMATGRPTILGWDGHEYQWRRGSAQQLAELEERKRLVTAVFETPTVPLLTEVLDRYGVDYAYLGRLERHGLGPACQRLQAPAAQELEALLEELGWSRLFQSGDVAIYGRPGSSPSR